MDSNTLPVITTPRVLLRWISEDDINGLYEVFSDPRVMRYWSSGPLPNREAAAELQREIASSNKNESMLKWASRYASRTPSLALRQALHEKSHLHEKSLSCTKSLKAKS